MARPNPTCAYRLAAVGLLTAASVPQAHAQTLKPGEILSSISVTAVAPPRPVLGADNRIHLAYELIAGNTSRLFITLNKVEALDPAGHSLGGLEGQALAAMVTTYAGNGLTISPGGSAAVFMDTSFRAGTKLPPYIAPRVSITRQLAGPGGKPMLFPAGLALPPSVSFTGPNVALDTRPAVLIDPPLRGARWVAANGCCDALTSHRGAIMPVNGLQRVPERFAIDWLRLAPDGAVFKGDASKPENFAGFGVPVHAVADGTVVNFYDKAPEQVPNTKPRNITTENIGGNMLVIDIGGGNYAFFAHLKPGSLLVKLGEHVKRGQVIAQLGNTGQSDAPHLHFHVMDGPSPLDANGLPFVYTHFAVRGTLDTAAEDALSTGKAISIPPGNVSGPHQAQLPLNDEVVDFPD